MNGQKIFLYFLGTLIVVIAVGLVCVLLFVPFPQGNRDILTIAVGAVLAKFGSVIDYFFGSSQSSANKSQTIHEQLKTAN